MNCDKFLQITLVSQNIGASIFWFYYNGLIFIPHVHENDLKPMQSEKLQK